MGKNLKNADLVMRTGKLAFYKIPGNDYYTRMEGFTSLSTSKGAKEYSRQYVDEDFERTDITGYATSTSYELDRYDGHPVTDDIISIHENELIGQNAVRSIIQVDMTTVDDSSGYAQAATGKMRDYAVIPDTDGDTTDCMTYSGTFKTRGEMEDVTVYSTDDFQTIYVSSSSSSVVLASLSVQSSTSSYVSYTPDFSSTTTQYYIHETGTLYILVSSDNASDVITVLYNGVSTNGNGKSVTCSNVETGDTIYVTVSNGTKSTTYTINVTEG